jgi:probable HAF family extracellular repeat protein
MRCLSVVVGAVAGVSILACANDATQTLSPPVPPIDTAAVASLEISLTKAAVIQSGSLRITALVKAADGSPLSSRTVVWTTSDPAIATVVATGAQSASVLGVAPGSASITAAIGSVSATLSLIVVAVQVPTIGFVWSAATGMVALRPLLAGADSRPTGINDAGVIVGGSAGHAVRWVAGGSPEDLGTLPGGGTSQANGINNKGQVVGWSSDVTSSYRAFLWSQTGGMIDIGTLPGDRQSVALAINDSGVVVGFSSSVAGSRPFRWTVARGMESLGALPPYSAGFAAAVNDVGIIVGSSGNDGEDYFNKRATLWKPDGSTEELGPCSQSHTGDSDCLTLAYGINHDGDVVGRMEGSAVRWVAGGGATLLSTLPGVNFGEARAINNAGTAVGYFSYDVTLTTRAFVWTQSGGMQDLGVLPGTTSSVANGINNSGQIVGYSR